MIEQIDEALSYIRSRSRVAPAVGIILGSGLGRVVDSIRTDVVIPFSEIPGAPVSSIVGHSGNMVLGHCGEVPVIVMQGRVHYYEGFSMEEVLFLPRVVGRSGIGSVVVTNAAGGVNTAFAAGDLMLISDHINMFGVNPLRGRNCEEFGPRFPDMTESYPEGLRKTARSTAERLGIAIREGVYMGLPGPTYETPAEVRAYRILGADAVGMSTVPEVIALNHMGIPAVGISCITNMASGILPQKLDHAEVLETTTRVQRQFSDLLLGVVNGLPRS